MRTYDELPPDSLPPKGMLKGEIAWKREGLSLKKQLHPQPQLLKKGATFGVGGTPRSVEPLIQRSPKSNGKFFSTGVIYSRVQEAPAPKRKLMKIAVPASEKKKGKEKSDAMILQFGSKVR